jgi:hypothetical protein
MEGWGDAAAAGVSPFLTWRNRGRCHAGRGGGGTVAGATLRAIAVPCLEAERRVDQVTHGWRARQTSIVVQ